MTRPSIFSASKAILLSHPVNTTLLASVRKYKAFNMRIAREWDKPGTGRRTAEKDEEWHKISGIEALVLDEASRTHRPTPDTP